MQARRAPRSLERLEWPSAAAICCALRAYVTPLKVRSLQCEIPYTHIDANRSAARTRSVPTLALYSAVDASCAQSCHWPRVCVVIADERDRFSCWL
jgi:hypothetical protein